MVGWTGLIGILGPLSVSVLLIVLGMLSRKLGRVTHAKPFYLGFYLASLFVQMSVLVRLARLLNAPPLQDKAMWGLIYNGLFAFGVTLGVFFAWRYWSWLLAERS